jgi:CII-binding regulator of phage lambda lysogenization HflD
MGVAERVWSALTSMIKLEDKVTRQADALKTQQSKIEDLTARVIRLETQLEMLTSAAMIKRLKGD